MTGHEAIAIAREISTEAIASALRHIRELEELEKQIEFNRRWPPTQQQEAA